MQKYIPYVLTMVERFQVDLATATQTYNKSLLVIKF